MPPGPDLKSMLLGDPLRSSQPGAEGVGVGRSQEAGSSPWLPSPRAVQALPRDCKSQVGARTGWALPTLLDSDLCIQVPPSNVHLGVHVQ